MDTENTDYGDWEDTSGFRYLQDALEKLYVENPELSQRVQEELRAAASGEENILLVGTDGEFSVTILHLDPELIGENKNFTLFPTSSSISILAGISREYLEGKIRECEEIDERGDGAAADEKWDTFMHDLMQDIVHQHRENPRTF